MRVSNEKLDELQAKILEHIEKLRLVHGVRAGILSLATGLGKTIACAKHVDAIITKEFREKNQDIKEFKLLFLVHSTDILLDALDKFQRHFCNKARANCFEETAFARWYNDSKDNRNNRNWNFLFSTFQSFISRGQDLTEFDYIL